MNSRQNPSENCSYKQTFVKSEDGHSFGMRLYVPETSSNLPPIMFAPAMGVIASYYDVFGKALASEGMTAGIFDLRGYDTSSLRASRDCDFGYHEIVEYDFPAAAEYLMRVTGRDSVITGGHSLGGQLSCLYSGLHPDRIEGIVLVASCSVYYKKWPFPHNYGTLVFEQFAHIVAEILGYFPGRVFRFGRQEGRRVVRDWSYQGRTGIYRIPESSPEIEIDLAGLSKNVFAASFTDDFYCPEAAVEHLLSKMPKIYPIWHKISPSDCGADRVGHFGWVKHARLVASLVSEWAEKCFPAPNV